MFYRFFIPIISTTIFTTIFFAIFCGYFILEYTKSMEKSMYVNIDAYGEVDIHHLCNVTSCNGIFFNGEYYGVDPITQLVSLQHTAGVKISDELIRIGNVSIRKNLSFVFVLLPDEQVEPAYFVVESDAIIKHFMILYLIILVTLNGFTGFILYVVLLKEKVLYAVESSKDKAALQFDNLMFYIENLNHEVNTPLFVLSRKIKIIERKMEDESLLKDFEIINSSIDQIQAVMLRTREVKRFNKSSEDKSIYDLLENTIITISVMRAETFESEISPALQYYDLDQKYLENGMFINIITNHIKNSIEAFATKIKCTFITVKNDRLVFRLIDNGNGVPEKYRKSIFNRGFSTKGSKTERGSGLSINKDILESSNGHLEYIDSDEGTIFEITIPVKMRQV